MAWPSWDFASYILIPTDLGEILYVMRVVTLKGSATLDWCCESFLVSFQKEQAQYFCTSLGLVGTT